MHALRKAWDTLGAHTPDADSTAAAAVDKPAVWHYSSFELMNGLDVTECLEEVSGEVFHELSRR